MFQGQNWAEYLRMAQVAAMLGLTTQRVGQYTRLPDNPLPTVRIGRSVFIKRSELYEWMEEHKSTTRKYPEPENTEF